jgi:hypothetical protein
MDYTAALSEVFSQARYQNAFVLLLFVLTPLLAITSDIFVLATMQFNPILDQFKASLMAVIVVLMSLNATVVLHNYEKRKPAMKSTTALGATVAAFFTTACPVCQPIWLLWFGLGSATVFLAEISVYVALLSIALFVFSLHYSLKSVSNICEVKPHGKGA